MTSDYTATKAENAVEPNRLLGAPRRHGTQKLNAFNFMRLLAAWHVVLLHTVGAPPSPFCEWGGDWVVFFFALSGFLQSLGDSLPSRAGTSLGAIAIKVLKRGVRLMPMYYLALVLTYIGDYKFLAKLYPWRTSVAPWAEILMLQGWWSGWPRWAEGRGADRIELSDCVNQPAWFVSTLWLYTIMTPFLEQLLLNFTTKRALGALLFCCVVAYPLVNPLCNFYPVWDRILGRTEFVAVLLHTPTTPFAYLNQYFAGMVLGKLFSNSRAQSALELERHSGLGEPLNWTALPGGLGELRNWTGLCCLVGIVCTMWLTSRNSLEFLPGAFRPMDASVFLAPMLLLIWALAHDTDILGTVFSSRWCNWADQAAFGVYMLQVPFRRACALLGVMHVRKGTDCATVLCMLGILTLIGWLAHRLVEAPLVTRLQERVSQLKSRHEETQPLVAADQTAK